MAKSAKNRHHANRLVKNYTKLLKQTHPSMLTFVGFGYSYNKDPFDCGNPGCFVCHHEPTGKSSSANKKKDANVSTDSIEDYYEQLEGRG
ncbi:MAG: hypothetical protein KME47_09530 [Nodosilinea sp. WJT8-NPBG4]|jgi:hypothetical protein|nr:hypothetical protein [Nodosilinea sp. WJT8-NPBG4]